MKEQFEKRTLTGGINVTCKFDDGTTKQWITRKEEVIEHIVEIVQEYKEAGYILTLRQLHYQLVTKNWIINHDTCYKKLGTILDDCRYAGVIDWAAFEDRGRIPYLPYWVVDIEDALKDTVDAYRLDRQDGQAVHVELWTEKDALSGILKRSTEKYHIQLVVNKGYTSSSAIYEAYQRCIRCINAGQKVVILYFGDHDPSGLDMIRDINDRLTFMLERGRYSYEVDDTVFEVIPIGLTMQQIKKYKLPPNPTKLTDSRSDKYIAQFGKTCWEVDALKPQILSQIVETNIEAQIDMSKYAVIVEQEETDIEALQEFINTRKND